MKYSILNIVFWVLLCNIQALYGQKPMPIIKATSTNVAIKDGDFFDKNAWSLSPETKLDVFTADRTRKPKWVVFYTDIDSIKVKVKPGTRFNFIILLNGKDTCFTQIASSIPPENQQHKTIAQQDTIPFTLTEYNAISIKSIINQQDTVNLHLDLGSLDFRLTKDAILKKTQLLSNQPDALAGKAKPNFNNLEPIRSITMGKVIWQNPNVGVANMAARNMDGRFGWRVFEGKIVEIDYENHRIILHTKLPKYKKHYAKANIEFIQSLFCIKSAIEVNGKKHEGNFLYDTGSDLAMVLDSSWTAKQHFQTEFPLIKKSSFSDGTGRKYETKIVTIPLLNVNGYVLKDIPTSMLGMKSPVGFDMNYFGNNLLKRFNIIIDLQHDHIYLKPNTLANLAY